MADVYISKLSDVELDKSGVAPHPSGGFVAALPLRDRSTGLFARLCYEDQLKWCAKNSARLMTLSQHRALATAGHYIKPVTLVSTSADAAMMRGLAFCQRHDAAVQERLIRTQWDGKRPVCNVGKHFLEYDAGARVVPPKCVNVGWSKAPGIGLFIQEPGHHHDSKYTDYSQLCQPWFAEKPAEGFFEGLIRRIWK